MGDRARCDFCGFMKNHPVKVSHMKDCDDDRLICAECWDDMVDLVDSRFDEDYQR